jgi:hypothetical protein
MIKLQNKSQDRKAGRRFGLSLLSLIARAPDYKLAAKVFTTIWCASDSIVLMTRICSASKKLKAFNDVFDTQRSCICKV